MCLKSYGKIKLPCAFGCGRTIDTGEEAKEYRGVGVYREGAYLCPACRKISWVPVGKTEITV